MYPCLSGFPLSLSLLLLRSLSPPTLPVHPFREIFVLSSLLQPRARSLWTSPIVSRSSNDRTWKECFCCNMLAKPNIRPAVMFPFIISRSMNHFFFLDFSIVFESLLSYIVNPFAIPNIREISRFHDVVDATPYYAIPSVWCCKRDICKTVYTNARTEIK